MENHNFQEDNPLYMVIFNGYVKLPEGSLGENLQENLPSGVIKYGLLENGPL